MAKASSIVIAGKTRSDSRYVNITGDTMTGALHLNGDTFATQNWVTNSIINGAPGTLDTLNELAAALGDDANFATTVTNSISGKVSKSGDTMTGNLTIAQSSGNNIFTLNSTGGGTPVIYMNAPSRGWGQFVSNNNLTFKDETGNIEVLTLEAGGNVGVGLTDPAYKLDVSGDVNASGNVRSYGFQGNGNVGGTGSASWHPSGIYSAGYNWLYGGGNFNDGDWNNMGNLRTYNSGDGFWARYNVGNDNYAATLFWNTLQLGNNGQNVIYVGKTGAGGYLDFYTNVTGDRSTSGAVLAMRLHASGRVSINSGTDSGYGLTVGGGIYTDTWVRVTGSAGIYFESHGGGWNMSDGTWIRAYNDKGIYTGGYMRASRFEDANDSAYYLDPNASTSLQIAGKIVTASSSGTMMSNGAMSDAIGWNGNYGTYIGSTVGGTSYLYANGTFYTGGVFRTLIHSGNIGSQSVSYATSAGAVAWDNVSGKPTIPTNNNQLTNGAGYITSADGGNAQTLDGIDSTSFFRKDAEAQDISGYVRINKDWSGGTYGAESFTIRGTHPSIALRSTNANFKWLLHTDSSGNFRWYTGPTYDDNAWTNRFTFGVDNNFYIDYGHIYTQTGNSTQWNTAYGWGNHAGLYASSSHTHSYLPLGGGVLTGNIGRSAHNNGFLVGGYNNVGASASATNPIFTIGTSYLPAVTTLGDMYGIGYTRADASFMGIANGSGWGMYVAADGDARIWLDGSSGNIVASGTLSASGYNDSNWNTAYGWGNHAGLYLGASAKAADADKLDGYDWMQSGKSVRANEFYADNWFRNYNSNEGIYNEATGQHWYSDDDDYWNIAGGSTANGIRFRDEHAGTIRGYVYANNSNEIGFLDAGGSWAIRHTNDSATEFYDADERVFSIGQGGHGSNYGTVSTHGGGRGGYEGYSINERFVWMSSDSTMSGMFNDMDNQWMTIWRRNGSTELMYNGVEKFRTTSGGAHISGDTAGEDVLAVDGVNGRLFTVTDDLSDSLFSINTVAGLPVMEVSADNSIVIGKFGVSDPGTTYANGTIKVKAKENDYGISIIGDYMAGMSFYANKDDGYYASQDARLGWVGIYQGNLWFQSAAPAQYSAPQHYFDGPVYASIIYDSNDNGYYVNPNSTSRLGTVNANELRSYGNTYLGDGSGDETHINDIVRIGATDSGDAHLFFGEGSAAGSDYGAHWYWDSGYTFTWNTRNAGTDTALFTYVTNDTTYVNWNRHFNMAGKELNYVGQVHFNNDGPVLQRNNSRNLVVKGGTSSDVGIVGLDAAGNNRFQLYGAGNDYGFLDGTWAAWDLRKVKDGNLYMNNNSTYYLNTSSTSYLYQLSVNQNLYLDNNYGSSVVGLYSSTRYQGVWAMGDAYKLALDGTSPGTLYGIAWTHTNVGGQSKAGLGHQALFMGAGVTQTAIGVGIWTSGLITTTSYGTSANWNTAYGWGNHASAGYLTSLPSHNHDGSYLPIGGKAADSNLLDGLDLHTDRNNEVNKVVRTDGNGYIQAGWINTISGAFSSAIDRIYCSNDGYIRYQTPANFISNLGLITTSSIGSQSVSYASTSGTANTANSVSWGNVSGKPSTFTPSSHTHSPTEVGLGNVTNDAQVRTTYNTSLNSDTRNSRGATRLYRYDSDSDFSIQTNWTGTHWHIRGYSGDSFHAEARVGYADSAGSATNASTAGQVVINYNNDSNAAYQMLWGSGNNVYGTGNIYCNPSTNIVYAAAFYDSDNTGYYLNPNGYSNLYTARAYEWQTHSGAGYGVKFWGGSNSYSIQMSEVGNTSWGGRVAGETTSDYNMYFTMTGGTNRGFVFRNSVSSGGVVAGIDASGNFRAVGDVIVYASSDARLKDNVKPIENALDKVMQLRGVEFDWNNNQDVYTGHDIGVIAQEVEAVLPEIVTTRDTGYKAVKYEKLTALLIETVKELKAEIEELKAQLNSK